MVFNFKERLKLVLCAVSHMDKSEPKGGLNKRDLNYKNIVENFEYLHGNSLPEIASAKKQPEMQETQEMQKLQEIIKVKAHERKQQVITVKKALEKIADPGTARPVTRSHKGGSNADPKSYCHIGINEIFDDIPQFENENPVKKFESSYKKLNAAANANANANANENANADANADAARVQIFELLSWISFSTKKFQRARKDKILKILKVKFVESLQTHEKFIHYDLPYRIVERVKTEIGKLTLNDFAEYLNPLFLKNASGTVWGGANTKKIIPRNKTEFDDVYKNTPIAYFVEKEAQIAFNKYITDLFEYLLVNLLKDIIEKELERLNKKLQEVNRQRPGLNYTFEKTSDPLLRMFLCFVSDCVGCMTSEITKENDFWHKLEKSIGNEISLDDETLERKIDGKQISLFDYLEEELGKSEEEEDDREIDKKIKFLIVKAKLIYLLQNYHYF